MNKKFLLLLIPITTLVLSGCGKRSPGGSTSGDDPTTAQPTSGATTGSPTSGTTGGSSGTTGTTGGSSTSGSSSSSSSGSSSSSSSSTPSPKSSMQIAYEAAAALPKGTKDNPSISTESYTYTGVVVGTVGKSYFVQDGNYGMYVYNDETISPTVGKAVSVTSKVQNFGNTLETSAVSAASITGDGTLPTSLNVSSKAILDGANQNLLAHTQATFVSHGDDPWAEGQSGKNELATFKIGGQNVTIKFDKFGYDASKAAILSAAVADEVYDLTGLVTSKYNNDMQLIFVGTSTIAKQAPSKTLDHISVTNPKISYLQGDTFVKPTVTAHYDDSSTEPVTDQAAFTGYNLANVGPQTVTVSYNGKSTTYGITVSADELQSIAIGGSMTDTSYVIGESWDPSGLTVTGTYSSGEKDVTSLVEWSYSPLTPEAAGVGGSTLEVTASLSGKSDSKQITVEVNEASSGLPEAYAAAAALNKDTDTGSTKYKFTGVVSATLGNTYIVQEGQYGMLVFKPASAVTGLAVGKIVETESVLCNYRNALETKQNLATGTVKGDGAAPTPIAISSFSEIGALNQNILTSVATAEFVSKDKDWASNASAIVVFAIGGNNVNIKFDALCYNASKAAIINAATAGQQFSLTNLFTTKYNDNSQLAATDQTAIAEVTKEIDSISISTHATMLSYVVGDHFNPTGLVIDVLYDDDSHDLIPYAGNEAKFSFSPSLTTALTSSDTSVAITYGGKTANESISVVEDTLQEIVISGDMTKKSYSVGDAWDPSGLVATGNYNISGAKVLADVVWAYSPATATAGTTSVNVTASKAGVTSAAFTVNGITVSTAEEHTVSWTATSGALGSAISSVGGTKTGTISTGSFQWNYTRTLASGVDNVSWQSTQSAIQLGKNGGVEGMVLSTSNIPGTIKSVTVVCASYNNAHTVAIKVDGVSYFSGNTPKWTGSDGYVGPVEGTGSSSGQIVITFASGSRALYIKSLTVVYVA